MGNETSSNSASSKSKRGSREAKAEPPPPTLALVFGSHGVGKRSVWTQAITRRRDGFRVAYDDAVTGTVTGRQSMRVETAEVEGVLVESVFAAIDDATSTILTARFKQTRVFVLVYDVCDRESFLDVTAQNSSMDLLALIQATRRSFPSRKQKVFLVGNKIDEYADRGVWDYGDVSPSSSPSSPTSSSSSSSPSSSSSSSSSSSVENKTKKHLHAEEDEEEDGEEEKADFGGAPGVAPAAAASAAGRVAALEALNHWHPRPGCTLGKQARLALRARLRTTGRQRQVSRDEGRAVAMQHDLLFFETSACSGDGVSVIRRALEAMHAEQRE
jgi:hypothetical protein